MTGDPASSGSEIPSPKRPQPGRRGWVIAAVSTVAVAVVGATASALITPERIDGLFRSFGGAPAVATPSTTTSAPLAYKSVTSLDKALALEVPTAWAARDGAYDVTNFSGTAIITGTQVDSPVEFGEDGAYVGASAEFATKGQLVEASDDAITGFLESVVEELDWTLEGCVPAAASAFEKDGWFVDSRAWKDCASITGSRLWEIAMIPEDRSALVSIQVLLTPDAPAEIVDMVVSSLVVDARRLPTGT